MAPEPPLTDSDGEPPRTAFERAASAAVASRPGAWYFVNLAPHVDRVLLRLTGGRLTSGGIGRVGVLSVRGAKSGVERNTPLVFTRDGDDVLLVASRGGDVKHPAWYHNVVANPDVRFSIGNEDKPYRAHTAAPEERPRVWRLVNRTYAGYEVYQRRAGEREIPVVVLEPR